VRPPSTAAPAPSPHRPRWVRRIAFTIGLILAVSAILFLWLYQPLSANGSGAYWVDPRFGMRVGDFTSPTGDTFSAYDVRYEDGRLFRYALTLYNKGPLPITITGIGGDGCNNCLSPLEFERSLAAPETGPFQFDQRHARPFRTVSIDPGEYRFVVVESRFDHCEGSEKGTTYGYTTVSVVFRMGFVSRTVELPMPFTFEVRMGPGGCPNGFGSAG